MSYYGAGDYYGAGGLLGSLWGGIKGAVGGLVSSGPIGAVTGAITGLAGGGTNVTPINVQVPASIPVIKTPGITGAVQRFLPGGATGYQIPVGAVAGMGGYHTNKTGYWTKGGYVPPGSKLVKNRRMNPGNARALRRSIRREKAFVGLAKRVLRGTGLTVKRTAGIASRRRRR